MTNAKKNSALRKKLEKLNIAELFDRLAKLSPKMAASINQSDKNNKRRLIRYLEIIQQDKNFKSQTNKRKYQTLIIGLDCPAKILKRRIAQRLIKRLKEQNLIGEVESLLQKGLSWKKLEDFGLEYKYISLYLQKKLSYQEMVEKLNLATNQFARRQMSWFRRWQRQGAKIHWCSDYEEVERLVEKFLRGIFIKKEPG